MTTNPPPGTPTVAIARVLRGLGLTQGRGCDFRVTGTYQRGERIGTYVLALTRHADETITAHADEIERLTGQGPFPFRVSVRYFNGKPRPVTTVANYGSRIRETPPAPAGPPAPADPPAPASAPTPPPAPAPAPVPAVGVHEGARERGRQKHRAGALNWSAGQGELVAATAAGQLRFDADGTLRHRPRPGWAGQAVADGRLAPLQKAGFVVVDEPDALGVRRVRPTDDGRDALVLWRRWRPAPAVNDRAQDREPLRPLLDGQEATRRKRAFAEDRRQREADAKVMYAAMDEAHAWEERDERLYGVWAAVQGITYRLGRKRPADWVPTAAEVAEYHLDPALVAELAADVQSPQTRPDVPRLGPARLLDLPPLPAAPDEVEQLGLFAQAA